MCHGSLISNNPGWLWELTASPLLRGAAMTAQLVKGAQASN